MATLLMPPDHHQQQQQQRRAKKAKNGQKKQPQRGLGVAQLEKLRMQEESKKVMLATSLIAASSSSGAGAPGAPHAVSPHQLPLVYHPQLQAAVAFQQRGAGSLNLNAFHSHFLPALLKPELVDHPGHHFGFSGCSSARKQQQQQPNTDSSSCKSGVSSEKQALACSSSPSPCSSSQHNTLTPGDDAGDESSRGSGGFLAEPRMKNPGLILSNLIATSKEGLLMPPSSAPAIDSDLFDPSFRTRKRVYDSRDWPAVYGVPAIKELSSFQIPGNTHPALSQANRTRCCEGPWSGVRDGVADTPAKIIGSASSPTSFSSWPRSEVCFSFDGTTTKDSCSSSLNLNNNSNNNNNNNTGFKSLEATSGSDFLALSLATSGSGSCQKFVDDRESSSERIVNDQEASGETDEGWSHHLQPHKYIKVIHSASTTTTAPVARKSSPVTLELSLNVATADDSSLELKLAL